MEHTEKAYRTLSNDALQVLKGVFGRMHSIRDELRFNNQLVKAHPRTQAALDELVKNDLIEHTKDGDADVYKPDLDLNHKAIARIGRPKGGSFPITVQVKG